MIASLLALPLATAPAVLPGQSMGPVKLGMTDAQLTALGAKPGRFDTERRVGAFDVRLEGGTVVAISYELGQGKPITLGGKTVNAKTPQALAMAAGNCAPLEMRIGGNIIECTAGLVIGQHRGGMMVTVQAPATQSDSPVCDGYLEPGNPHSQLDVQPGKHYCLPSRVVTTATVEADVLGALRYNTCQTQRNRGATIVTCPFQGTRFVFAGPAGALHAVSGVPMKR